MNKLVLIFIIIVGCNAKYKQRKHSHKEYAIDSIFIKHDKYYSKFYTISNTKYLNKNRIKFKKSFIQDECFNCKINSKTIPIKDSNYLGYLYIAERQMFDYQYWNNGIIKSDNSISLRGNQLYLKRIEYDSFNHLTNENIFLFVKDTTLLKYEFKISGWFKVGSIGLPSY